MDAAQRIVTRLPLHELWRGEGSVISERARLLASDDVMKLLRNGRVRFVVADVGASLLWVPTTECFEFWKGEAKPHLAKSQERIRLGEFVDGYCYIASEWVGRDTLPVVLLEKHH